MKGNLEALPARNKEAIGARETETLWGLFRQRAQRSPDSVAYRDYDPVMGLWRDHTWHAISERVDRFRHALAQEPLQTGDRVAILLGNGTDWVCLDLAAHAAGLVVVGLYPYETAANNAYILGHSDARLVLLDTAQRWRDLSTHLAEFPMLARVWVREGDPPTDLKSATVAVRLLADILPAKAAPPGAHRVSPDDTATLIYTSGTTGRPKGVILSHTALLLNAEGVAAILPPRADDIFLSLLPLAHAFERTVGYYLPMMGGATIAFSRSAKDLREDLATVRPTALLAVPRLFEHMSAAIAASIEGNVIKRWMLDLAATIGWRRFKAIQQRRRPGMTVRLLWPMLARYVAAPILAAFGGRLRVAVSGGAPLDSRIAKLIIGLGIPVVEGYGLTEAAPVVAANSLENNVPGSVGPPLPGVSVRIGKEGEILVRSPSIMKGYWKDPAETTRVLDPDGWLSTGDIGEIKDRRVYVRGRLKEMIVLSIGEKINPNAVEAAILRDPLFAQVAVAGDGRPFLIALIVLNRDAWKAFAAENGLAADRPNDRESLVRLITRLDPLLSELPRFARIRAAYMTLEPWTIEAGALTPTLKVKREVVRAKFAREIDALYTAAVPDKASRG